uniref:NADH-ubiquinone oxidoreductase chain 2 n=1 Tax=Craugastor megacephalus TaxID=228431 RepID=Q53EF0_9NEOB|nr:NADH dehydrogenase subunit II [Craugastor megacephalus]
MNLTATLLISLSLILGPTLTLSSHHWILAWLGLEISTFALIPLILNTPNPRATEAATKYFLAQSVASTMMLFSCALNAWLTGGWAIPSTPPNTTTNFLTVALLIKLGIAPFHFWVPDVMQGLSLPMNLILSTWQKLPPVALLLQLTDTLNLTLLLMAGLTSTVVGGWGGINQTQLRKIMAYSSISHMGWMVIVLKLSPKLALLSFTIYVMITSTLFLIFINLKTKTLRELINAWPKSPPLAAMSLLILLSLGGLPPLTGFLPKWLIAQELIKHHLFMFTALALTTSLLTLFFYLRLTYILTLTLAPQTTFSISNWFISLKTYLALPITLSTLLLPLFPFITALL